MTTPEQTHSLRPEAIPAFYGGPQSRDPSVRRPVERLTAGEVVGALGRVVGVVIPRPTRQLAKVGNHYAGGRRPLTETPNLAEPVEHRGDGAGDPLLTEAVEESPYVEPGH
jgi:hypothetical protein